MKKMLDEIVLQLTQTEHGFKHIVQAGDTLFKNKSSNHFENSKKLIAADTYQGRMLGTYLLGILATENKTAFEILKNTVATDENWRVQEMLAKAFDHYAKIQGYEKSLPEIKDWLADKNPNVNRAVIEGLRIWTSRPYFRDHPETAISLISQHKVNPSEYVRKSVGNALRDISKKFKMLVREETDSWELNDPLIRFTFKVVEKS